MDFGLGRSGKRGPARLKGFYSRTVDNLCLESGLESSLQSAFQAGQRLASLIYTSQRHP